MNVHAAFPREHIVLHALVVPGQKGLIGCMDRRFVKADDPHLGDDRLFHQLRGGRYGLSGIAVAMEVAKPGSFIDLGIRLADFAQTLGSVLQMAGIITTKHGPSCGGIELARITHDGVASGGEDPAMFQNSRKLNPGLAELRYEEITDGARRIQAADLCSGPKKIKSALTEPPAALWTPLDVQAPEDSSTPHVELVDTDHDSVWFVTDFRPDQAFDRAAAHRDGCGAYYSSLGMFGSILPLLPEHVRNNVEVKTWQDVESVFLGRIATYDITHIDENGELHPYPIEAIGY